MRKITDEFFAGKLIWQEISPAPFESGWSIFSKLMGLNAISPRKISKLICKQQDPSETSTKLRYREGEWIDFLRFSYMVNVDPERLKSGFLDTWNKVEVDYINGQKWCNSCLIKGYHSVFFDLGFVNICPWHLEKLVCCKACLDTVYANGLKYPKEISMDERSYWSVRSSKCKHIHFDDMNIVRANLLSSSEIEEIEKSSSLFLDWWIKLQSQPEVFEFLSKNSYSRKEITHLNIFLNAAESIVGKCPWPLENKQFPVKTLTWDQFDQVCEKYDKKNCAAKKSSQWGKNYRSVQKYLFHKYIKPHKSCWNFLINTHQNNHMKFDLHNACYLCIAFVTWRLINENLLVVEALNNPKIKFLQMNLLELPGEKFVQSNRAQVNLLYAQFFLIWHMIIEKKFTESKIAIHIHYRFPKEYIPFITYNRICTVLIPSPDYLQRKSKEYCSDRKKKNLPFLNHNFPSDWFDTLSFSNSNDNRIVFKLISDYSRRRFYYLSF